MSDNENPTSHLVDFIQVVLSFQVTKPAPKTKATPSTRGRGTSKTKSAAPKMVTKADTKTKEFKFTFEKSSVNYTEFLTEILDLFGHSKYTPVKMHTRFNLKVCIGKKGKTNAVDIDELREYDDMVTRILSETPSKLYVYVDLENVKECAKRPERVETDEEEASGQEDVENGSNDEDGGHSAIEHELGRLRLILEKHYANPTDKGYTYVTDDGERVPLTPAMMSEWARAMYDGETTWKTPPNSLSFDPRTRGRSLYQDLKRANGIPAGGNTGQAGETELITVVSSLLRDARHIYTGAPVGQPSTPITNVRGNLDHGSSNNCSDGHDVSILTSPPKNTPSKLVLFLRYAEDHAGVSDATSFERALAAQGYGPDIMDQIDKDDLVACGVSAGDAIRLKRVAPIWWASPDAKRVTRHASEPPSSQPGRRARRERIRFEKRFLKGGASSAFGSGMVPGIHLDADTYDWWFFNDVTDTMEQVPDGYIPSLADEYC